MWQIMWAINLIPEGILSWIINLMIVAGFTGVIASWIGKWIPFYGDYARILKPIGIVLLVAGVYLKGGEATNHAWLVKVAELEEQVKVSEAKSVQANDDLAKKTKEKVKVVKEVQVVIQERIKEVTKKIDADCKVDAEAIEIINDAAKNQVRSKK